MSNSAPVVLDADSLDAIESNLADGKPYAKACGRVNTMAIMRASLALEKTDPTWAARVRAAEAKGAAVRAEQARAMAEATRPRLPVVGVAREEASDGSGIVGAGDTGGGSAVAEVPAAVEVPLSGVNAVGGGRDLREHPTVAPPARNALPSAVREAMAEHSKRGSEATDDGQPDGNGPQQSAEWQDTWARRIEEATALADGYFGFLLWVERRCVDAKLHAMDRQWLWHFSEFYASEKFLDVGRWGLRAAKSDSVIRALVAESQFIRRVLEPGLVGVCPIMSANMREAEGRFATAKEVLRACGLRDLGPRTPAEDGGYRTGGGGNAPRTIELKDSQSHPIEFRIYPANEAGAAGFTGIAGFGDELDLWGKPDGANPARRVVEVLVSRFTTQPGARLHLMSATYDRKSYHAELIDQGDTIRQRVARLGVRGAEIDTAARRMLAKRIGSADPLLTTEAKPDSTNIGCWVSNDSVAPIWDCYVKMNGDLRRMMATHGACPEFAGKGGGWTVAMAEALGRANRTIVKGPEDVRERYPTDPRFNGMGGDGL